MNLTERRVLTVNAVAPTRVCDIGGWTDTWFAKQGNIFNIAVFPCVEVQIQVYRQVEEAERVTLSVENFGETYQMDPEHISCSRHPLLEAAIETLGVPKDLSLKINVFSEAPPGASTGTSAAVSVALIGALDVLGRGRRTPHEVAALAQWIETERLGLQCGIQDQLASAYGGINFIQMYQYPHASVSPVRVPHPIWWELEQRLVVVYAGKPHRSSEIHQMVIDRLGPEAHRSETLRGLGKLAAQAKDALFAGDFRDLGRVMNLNTEAQRSLHADLVCESFEEIISVSRDFGALGCKINGAGGDGGSVTILGDGDRPKKRQLLHALEERGFGVLPVRLSSRGLYVWTGGLPWNAERVFQE